MTGPTILCVFKQSTPLGGDPAALVTALQKYVDQFFGPAWGLTARLSRADSFVSGHWGLLFTDDADQAGALGYHNLTDQGLPLGHIFVRTAQRSGEAAATVASHELAELLADPGCNRAALSPRGRWVALEPCDPVERDTFQIDGLPMSNFVTPSWFGQPGDGPFDCLKRCDQPWQLLAGGYVPVWTPRGWSQIFGDTAAAERYERKDKRLRRTERRRLGEPGHTGVTGNPL